MSSGGENITRNIVSVRLSYSDINTSACSSCLQKGGKPQKANGMAGAGLGSGVWGAGGGIPALPSPVNQGENFQPSTLLANRVSPVPGVPEVYFPQVANPPPVATGYRKVWVNATLVEKKVREYGRQSAL